MSQPRKRPMSKESTSRKRPKELPDLLNDRLQVLQQICSACERLDTKHVNILLTEYYIEGIENDIGILHIKPLGHAISGFLGETYNYFMNSQKEEEEAEYNTKKEATKTIIRMLLRKGATTDYVLYGQQTTYLHECITGIYTAVSFDDRASRDQKRELLKIFLSIDELDPNVVDHNGNTILHTITQYHMCDTLIFLLKHSRDKITNQNTGSINKKNMNGETPLISALNRLQMLRNLRTYGHIREENNLHLICELLLKIPTVDVDILTNSKRSAFIYACDINDRRNDRDEEQPKPSLLRTKIYKKMEKIKEAGIEETPGLHNIVFRECGICLRFLCDDGSVEKPSFLPTAAVKTITPPSISMLSCGHVLHTTCTRGLGICPFCREQITRIDILFKHDDGIVKQYINSYLKSYLKKVQADVFKLQYEEFLNPSSHVNTYLTNLGSTIRQSVSALSSFVPSVFRRLPPPGQGHALIDAVPPPPGQGHALIDAVPPPPGPGGRLKQNNTNTKRRRIKRSSKRKTAKR